MARKRKFAKSIQQEGISRDQISERFKEFGWIPSPTNIDLGEDFIVHIYIDGNPTGKTFHLQAKSVTNIDERRKKNILVYKFKKQDIFDWEHFEDPVVLLVWDIKQRLGKWVLLEDVIQYLEKTNPQWRNNKSTVNVFIPWINTTNDEGLLGLRERIAVRMLPFMLGKRDFSITLKDEESEVYKELESLSKRGGVFSTSGKHFTFPNWFIRWFDPNNFTLTFESKLSSEPLYFKIIAADLDGRSFFHNTELFLTKRDEDQIVFSNEQLNSSIRIEFKLVKNKDRKQYDYFTNLSVNNFGKSVYETRDILLFLRAFINGNKRTMVFSNKDGETTILEGDDRKGIFPDDLNGILKILDKLCRIQDNVGFQISYPQEGISEKDLNLIEQLYQAIDKGKVELKSRKFEIELQKQGIGTLLKTMGGEEEIDGRFQLGIDSHFTLFGNKIGLGRLVRFISGKIDQTRSEISKVFATLDESSAFKITIHEPQTVDLYIDLLLKESKRIAGLLHRKYSFLSVFLIGSLAWDSKYDLNTKIQLALSDIVNFEEIVSYCKSISNYPLEIYRLSDLPEDVVDKIKNSESGL